MAEAQVFIQTAFLGDVLLSVPFLKNWAYLAGPDIEKILVCRKGVGALILSLGLVDQVIEVEKGNSGSYQEAVRTLNKYNIKVLLSAHRSLRTTLFVRKIKASKKIGYKTFFSFLSYTETIDRDLKLPEPLRLLQLLSPLDPSLEGLFDDFRGGPSVTEYGEDLKLLPPPYWAQAKIQKNIQDVRNASQIRQKYLVQESRTWVAIFPGSVWETKRWLESGFQAVAQDLIASGYGVLLFGGPEERGLCEAIATKVRDSARETHQNEVLVNPQDGFAISERILNLAGVTSLTETLSLLTHCRLAVTNDSAGAHLASLANIKVLTIFGPTVLDLGYRPWAEQTFIIERRELFCRPCGVHGHKKCPLGTHECMKSIAAEEVIVAIKRILDEKNSNI